MKKNKTEKFDFSQVRWDMVDEKKAMTIYNEALAVQREIWDSLNVLNGKAFSLLSLSFSFLSIVCGYLITHWASMVVALKVAGCVTACCLGGSLVFFILAVLPMGVRHGSAEPQAYFASPHIYQLDFAEMLHACIRSASSDIDWNMEIQSIRARRLKCGLVGFVASPVLSLLVFFAFSIF